MSPQAAPTLAVRNPQPGCDMRFKVLTCLILVLLPWAPLRAQTSYDGIAALEGTAVVLKAGDMIRITVWRKPELSGEFAVASDGSISHPLYRSIAVAGVPLSTIHTRVHDFLARFEANPEFVVEPLIRVAVGGEVRQPNLYTLRPETSIIQALAIAGGPTERGRRDRVLLRRDGTERVLDLGRTAMSELMDVRSGDELIVERRRAVFREYLLPMVSIAGAAAAILNVLKRD